MSNEALAEAWRGARLSTREVFEDKLEAWRTARAQAAQAKSDRREKRKATEQCRAQVTFSEWAASHANVIEASRCAVSMLRLRAPRVIGRWSWHSRSTRPTASAVRIGTE